MDRTNPTYRDAIRTLEGRWDDFKCALQYRDQPRLEQLFEYAQPHADAGGYLNHDEPLFPILVSIDLEQETRLDDLEDRIATVNRLGVKWFEKLRFSSSRKSTIAVRPRGTRPAPPVEAELDDHRE